jgi:hypothetical protein
MGRLPEHASRWRGFVEASTGHPPATAHSEKDEPEQWLAKQGDFDKPWNHKADTENQGDGSADDTDDGLLISAKRRRIWYKRIYVCPAIHVAMLFLLEIGTNGRQDYVIKQPGSTFNFPGTYLGTIIASTCSRLQCFPA